MSANSAGTLHIGVSRPKAALAHSGMQARHRTLAACSKLTQWLMTASLIVILTGSNELYGGIGFAVFAVTLVAFLIGCLSLVIPYGLPRTADDVTATFLIGFTAALVTFPFAAISALIVGIPLLLLWKRFGFMSLLQYLLAGVLMSAILGTAVALAHFLASFLEGGADFPLALWIIAVGGPVAALTVRWAARVEAARDG
jgi:hypothetical protein